MGAWPGIFTAEGAAVAALLLIRVTAIVWVAPVLSSRSVPASLKTAISVLLVLLLWPAASQSPSAAVTVATVLSELLIGLTIGLAAAIFIAAAESAGDMLAVQMGLSGANVLDPMSHTQMPVIGQFLGLFVTTLLLATGGHLAILGALSRSLGALPVGGPVDATEGIVSVVGLGSTLLLLGLRFAAPVVAAMMIGNASLGILGRTVPQINLLAVAFPIQIGIGLVVLALTLPLLAGTFADWPSGFQALADGLFTALQTRGGP